MRAPLTVIIPTLNAAPVIGPTLAALGEGLAAGLIAEVIICDAGSRDDIARIADMAGAVFMTTDPGRGGQLAFAAAHAKGKWLLFLHADCTLGAGWSDAVLTHLGKGTPAYFKLAFEARGFAPAWVAGWANLRSRLFGLPYGDQGLLIRRESYDAVGGYATIPLMEDVDLARRLRNLKMLPVKITTSAVRFQTQGWLRRGARNLVLLARYFLGADPEKLARAYRR